MRQHDTRAERGNCINGAIVFSTLECTSLTIEDAFLRVCHCMNCLNGSLAIFLTPCAYDQLRSASVSAILERFEVFAALQTTC